MNAKKTMTKTAKAAATKKSQGWTDAEKEAMRAHAREMKGGKGDGEADVMQKIAEMKEPDRSMAKRLHALIKENAPGLAPKTWYGMPAYAKDGKVVCFFQPALKFKTRYSTFGFSDSANLDDGALWPVAYALKQLTPTEEAKI